MNVAAGLLLWVASVLQAGGAWRPLVVEVPGRLCPQLDILTTCDCFPDASLARRERFMRCARYLLETEKAEESNASEAAFEGVDLAREAQLGRLALPGHDLAALAHATGRNSHLRC